MTVYVNNLVINSGADFSQNFILESISDGSPVGLSGYLISSKMRKHPGSSSSTTFSTQIINSSNGEIKIGLASTVTAGLKPGRYVYDIVVTDLTGFKTRVIEGMVLVREGVTR